MCVRVPLLGNRGVSVRIRKFGICRPKHKTMYASEGLLEPAFCALRVKKESRSVGSASGCGGCPRVMPLYRCPPRGVRSESREDRRGGETEGEISRRGMRGCALEAAWVPTRADLKLLEESGGKGVRTQRGTRPAPSGHGGS